MKSKSSQLADKARRSVNREFAAIGIQLIEDTLERHRQNLQLLADIIEWSSINGEWSFAKLKCDDHGRLWEVNLRIYDYVVRHGERIDETTFEYEFKTAHWCDEMAGFIVHCVQKLCEMQERAIEEYPGWGGDYQVFPKENK